MMAPVLSELRGGASKGASSTGRHAVIKVSVWVLVVVIGQHRNRVGRLGLGAVGDGAGPTHHAGPTHLAPGVRRAPGEVDLCLGHGTDINARVDAGPGVGREVVIIFS